MWCLSILYKRKAGRPARMGVMSVMVDTDSDLQEEDRQASEDEHEEVGNEE